MSAHGSAIRNDEAVCNRAMIAVELKQAWHGFSHAAAKQMGAGRAHIFCSDKHGCVPGAQAGKVGDEARVEGWQALSSEGLDEAVEHAGVLVGDVTCQGTPYDQRGRWHEYSVGSLNRQAG